MRLRVYALSPMFFIIKHQRGLANVVLPSRSLNLESTMSIASLGKVIVCNMLESTSRQVYVDIKFKKGEIHIPIL